MAWFDQVETFRRIADALRAAQRAAIEVENAPDKRKRLRTFSSQEVASLLGIRSRDVGAARNRLSFDDIMKLRISLYESSGNPR